MNIFKWLSSDGFLSFYHRSHPEYDVTPFPDSVDHTALWLLGEKLNGSMEDKSIERILIRGLRSRKFQEWGRYSRYPGSNEELKHDAIKSLAPLLRLLRRGGLADEIQKNYAGFTQPHQRDHLNLDYTWLGNVFEVGDSISDWFSDSESSQVKNMVRLAVRKKVGAPYKTALKVLESRVDLKRAIIIYGVRKPDTPASDYDHLVKLVNEGEMSPLGAPPIYLPWLPVIDWLRK